MRVIDIDTADATPYPLSLIVVPQLAADGERTLRISLKYLTDHLESAAARSFLDRFVGLLTQLATHPDVPVSRLHNCDDAERSALLSVRGPVSSPPRTLPEILAAGAELTVMRSRSARAGRPSPTAIWMRGRTASRGCCSRAVSAERCS